MERGGKDEKYTIGQQKVVSNISHGNMPGISFLSVSDVHAGRVTYVYDALNRLIRATYDKTTFTYTYESLYERRNP